MTFYNPARKDYILERMKKGLNPIAEKVYNKFGWESLLRSSGLNEFYDIINSLDCNNTCFEIGTFNGLTAAILAARFKKVVTIDIIDVPMKYDIWEYLKQYNIEFYKIDSEYEKKEIFNNHLCNDTIDMAYIDGDHLNCADMDYELVKSCNKILFHDAHGCNNTKILKGKNVKYYEYGYDCFALLEG